MCCACGGTWQRQGNVRVTHWLATLQQAKQGSEAKQGSKGSGKAGTSQEQGSKPGAKQAQGPSYSNTTSRTKTQRCWKVLRKDKTNLVLRRSDMRPQTRPKRGLNEVQSQPKAPVAQPTWVSRWHSSFLVETKLVFSACAVGCCLRVPSLAGVWPLAGKWAWAVGVRAWVCGCVRVYVQPCFL